VTQQLSGALIERVFGLPPKCLSSDTCLKLPETQALLRLVTVFPWLIEVADKKFDPKAVRLILQRESIQLQLQELDAETQQ